MLAKGREGITKIAMRLGKVWLDLQGFGEACDRLLMLPKIAKGARNGKRLGKSLGTTPME